MYARDRAANVSLLIGAFVGWALVAALFATRSPADDPGAQLLGALLLGIATALTLTPLFWLVAFARKERIAYRGDWWRASRRGLLLGLMVTLLVLLRGQRVLDPPILLFIVVMIVFVELVLSVRR